MESGASTACGQVAVHFQADPEPVRRAAGSPHASVRQRAQKLLGLLGDATAGGGSGSSVAPAGAQQQQQQLVVEDLLGEVPAAPAAGGAGAGAVSLADLLGEPESAAAAPASAFGAAGAAGGVDLLAGLDVAAAPAAAPAPPAPAQQPAAAASHAAEADIFGGMLLGGATAAPATLPAAARAPAVPQPSALDLLGGLSLGAGGVPGAAAPPVLPPQPQQPQQSGGGGLGDLLGGLSLGPAAPPAIISAFGYGGVAPPQQAYSGGLGLGRPGVQQPGPTATAFQQQQQRPLAFGGMQPLGAVQPLAFAALQQPYAQPVGSNGGLALQPPPGHSLPSLALNSGEFLCLQGCPRHRRGVGRRLHVAAIQLPALCARPGRCCSCHRRLVPKRAVPCVQRTLARCRR